jgi:class 3 adenylate cyclase
LLIRVGSRWGVGSRLRRDLERVYRRIDASLTGGLGRGAAADPFEPPRALTEPQRRRLDDLLATLVERGLDPAIVERLGEFLAEAPGPEVGRIQPLALARRLGLEPAAFVATCLHGAREGLLVLSWDIICPACRIAAVTQDSLRALEEHGHCVACHTDFQLDFGESVELIFRAHPQVRDADTQTYCAAGPAHSPHVVAQVRVLAGERLELDLDLSEGAYRLRGPQLPWSLDFRVRPGAPARRWDISLTLGPLLGPDPVLGDGGQVLALSNEGESELVARVERRAPRGDALTAARASSLAVFRELFPAEVLAPGRLVSISTVTLLTTALDRPGSLYDGLGDARAFAALHELFRLLDEVIRREEGALVKTLGEGILASFTDPAAAVRAALAMPEALAGGEATRSLRLHIGVHQGPAMAATLNDQLDYFGTTVHLAARAMRSAQRGELVLTRAVAGDPLVAALLQARGLEGEIRPTDPPGHRFGPLLALRVAPQGAN